MATFIDRPQARIPIATVRINGVEIPCEITIPWYRILEATVARVGGYSALSTADIVEWLGAHDEFAPQIDALRASFGSLLRAVEAVQAGEMVVQAQAAEQSFPDVMQGSVGDVYAGEMTWQI